METTNLSIRIDKELKEQADSLFAELGMNMTTAFTVFVRQAVREHGIPFKITSDPFYSESNMERLRKSIVQMEKTGGTVHEVNLDD